MAKEAAYRKEDEQEEYLRDTIDSERREEASNYQFPPAPANDNEPRSYSNTNIKNVRTARSGPPSAKIKKGQQKLPSLPAKPDGRNIVLAWRNFAFVAGVTSIIYPIQIFFGVINLIGLGILVGIESDWLLSAIDFGTFGATTEAGGGLLVLGMAGAFLCGFVGFLGATVVYTAVGKSILHDWSLLILTLCFVGLLLPIISLFPVMLFWYRYIAFAK